VRDCSGKEILAQGRFEIGDEFLKHARRGCRRMLDRSRLRCGLLSGLLSVGHGRSFQVRGFHRSDWGRRWGSNFFDYRFFDCGLFDYDFVDYGRGFVSRGWNFVDG